VSGIPLPPSFRLSPVLRRDVVFLHLVKSPEHDRVTYCVGLQLDQGLVMLADTRTNGGVDNICSFAKLHVFTTPGERQIAAMTAGNLAVSQAVIHLIREGLPDSQTGGLRTIHSAANMFDAASLVGEAVRWVFERHGKVMRQQKVPFDVSVLLGGQIAGGEQRLFQVYAAGNFIEATRDTPFLQVGEHKYGKPILDRSVTSATSLADGVKLALLSMDSTLRSNLSVGMPLDLLVYRRDRIDGGMQRRIDEHDAYFRQLRQAWSNALSDAQRAIAAPEWG
jgi:putative proteasome-type protease